MCTENEIITSLEKDKNEIMNAVKIINKIGPDIKEIKKLIPDLKVINVMITQNSKTIDREINDREKEDKEIKNNYLIRFEKIESMIKNTNKLLISIFVSIIIMFMGSTVFLVLNNIYKWFI